MTSLTKHRLREILSSFDENQSDVFFANCIVALERSHIPGCRIKVTGEKIAEFQIDWELNEVKKAGYQNSQKVTEKAAEALSFFLSNELTEYKVVEEAVTGTGIDYWLGYDCTHECFDEFNIFRAKLEVSGIEAETKTNSLATRTKIKRRQTDRGKSKILPVYISIVELSTPKAHFEEYERNSGTT